MTNQNAILADVIKTEYSYKVLPWPLRLILPSKVESWYSSRTVECKQKPLQMRFLSTVLMNREISKLNSNYSDVKKNGNRREWSDLRVYRHVNLNGLVKNTTV